MKIMGNNFEKKLFQPIRILFTYTLSESDSLYKVEDTMNWIKTLFTRSQVSIYVRNTVQQTVVHVNLRVISLFPEVWPQTYFTRLDELINYKRRSIKYWVRLYISCLNSPARKSLLSGPLVRCTIYGPPGSATCLAIINYKGRFLEKDDGDKLFFDFLYNIHPKLF